MTLALVYAMDAASRLADAGPGDGRCVSVVDARGVGLAHLDASAARAVVAQRQPVVGGEQGGGRGAGRRGGAGRRHVEHAVRAAGQRRIQFDARPGGRAQGGDDVAAVAQEGAYGRAGRKEAKGDGRRGARPPLGVQSAGRRHGRTTGGGAGVGVDRERALEAVHLKAGVAGRSGGARGGRRRSSVNS